MPAVSEAQQRAAGAELGRRRNGGKKKKKKKRAFAGATIAQLRDFARGGLRRGLAPIVKRTKKRQVPPTPPPRPIGNSAKLRRFARGRQLR